MEKNDDPVVNSYFPPVTWNAPTVLAYSRKANGDAMTCLSWSVAAICDVDSFWCTVTMTLVPLPWKIGSTCNANHPKTTTRVTTRPRMIRPSGLFSIEPI